MAPVEQMRPSSKEAAGSARAAIAALAAARKTPEEQVEQVEIPSGRPTGRPRPMLTPKKQLADEGREWVELFAGLTASGRQGGGACQNADEALHRCGLLALEVEAAAKRLTAACKAADLDECKVSQAVCMKLFLKFVAPSSAPPAEPASSPDADKTAPSVPAAAEAVPAVEEDAKTAPLAEPDALSAAEKNEKSAPSPRSGASEAATVEPLGPVGFATLPDLGGCHTPATFDDGTVGTMDYRLRFKDNDGKDISPWHDIPLHAGDGLFNFLVEIPRMTKPKMEVVTKEPDNPIAQDRKKGKLREYHGPIFWNYGMLPQTWEDPHHEHPEMKCKGDNDPLDVVEIGSRAHAAGSVVQVKILGVLALIDDGELDWKVLAICKDDPLASELNNVGDVEARCPGVVSGIREWFRWYKSPDGKLNEFGFGGQVLDKSFALEVVLETHAFWQRLRDGRTDKGKLWVPSVSAEGDKVTEVIMEDEMIGAEGA